MTTIGTGGKKNWNPYFNVFVKAETIRFICASMAIVKSEYKSWMVLFESKKGRVLKKMI